MNPQAQYEVDNTKIMQFEKKNKINQQLIIG